MVRRLFALCVLLAWKLTAFAVSGIPTELKAIYKTVWEISQKTIIDLSADRVRLFLSSSRNGADLVLQR